MIIHTPGKYIWPPRPETKVPPKGISSYESRNWVAQPKLNGSCAELITDGTNTTFMSRHNDTFANYGLSTKELASLHNGKGYMVLVGEYMNKSQRGSDGQVFNQKFVIFDILMYGDKHLSGRTFKERQDLLDLLYPERTKDSENNFLIKITDNMYRCRSFSNLAEIYENLVRIDMYEGIVMKDPTSKLGNGLRQVNNTKWQAKCRKPTKNYQW
tara:strand:- start:329 stop:967 length:639 start_codon:yes stop_codon:yes gene_type:complete